MRNENLFLSIVVFILSVVLIWFAIKAAIFVGWAIGGGLGIILALLFLFGVLDIGWLFGVIFLIIFLNFLFDLI